MDKQSVYHKTPKGLEELTTRAYKLSARERSALILVNGKSTGQQLIDRLKQLGDAEQYLNALLDGGFIAPAVVGELARGPRPPLPANQHPSESASSTQAAVPIPSLSSAKQFASHFILDEFGPDGELMATRIERCSTRQQLLPYLEKSKAMLLAIRGRAKADLFWEGVRARLPAS